jgi:hypothetical protein
MSRVAIGLADRLRRSVIAMDISTNLAGQVGDGGKDAAREQVSLDLRKPELDLVEPGRIGRREMQPHVRMLKQERAHGLGLMGREIVGDHVNLAALRLRGNDLAEEVDKRGTGVTCTVWPKTSPDCVFSAAKSDSVP